MAWHGGCQQSCQPNRINVRAGSHARRICDNEVKRPACSASSSGLETSWMFLLIYRGGTPSITFKFRQIYHQFLSKKSLLECNAFFPIMIVQPRGMEITKTKTQEVLSPRNELWAKAIHQDPDFLCDQHCLPCNCKALHPRACRATIACRSQAIIHAP